MMTMYTELLEAAMKVSKDAEKNAPTEQDRLQWRELNKACQLEMYRTRGKIHADRKKDLTRNSDVSTIEASSNQVGLHYLSGERI